MTSSTLRRRLSGRACWAGALGIALFSSTVACSGSRGSSDSSDAGVAKAGPIDRPICYDSGAALTTGGIDPVSVAVLGSGPKGVVLVPELGGDWCQWRTEALRLVDAGYHVAAVSWAIDGTESIPAGVAALKDAGATEVVLVGASKGGTYTLAQAADVDTLPVKGVAAFSPPTTFDSEDALTKIEDFAGPVLLVGSKGDPGQPISNLTALANSHPGDEQQIELDGTLHGVDIFTGPDAGRINTALDAFLTLTLG